MLRHAHWTRSHGPNTMSCLDLGEAMPPRRRIVPERYIGYLTECLRYRMPCHLLEVASRACMSFAPGPNQQLNPNRITCRRAIHPRQILRRFCPQDVSGGDLSEPSVWLVLRRDGSYPRGQGKWRPEHKEGAGEWCVAMGKSGSLSRGVLTPDSLSNEECQRILARQPEQVQSQPCLMTLLHNRRDHPDT